MKNEYEVKQIFFAEKRKFSVDSVFDSEDQQTIAFEFFPFKKRENVDIAYLCDENCNYILPIYKVDADKGFHYSEIFESYISQRKNHFQITIQVLVHALVKYVRAHEQYYEIDHYQLEIYAIKNEDKSERIEIHQSNKGDRRHLKYMPIEFKALLPNQENRQSAKRLHFGEITKFNKYVNMSPNPKQRYFTLVVELQVVTTTGNTFVLFSTESEKRIIVRVSVI